MAGDGKWRRVLFGVGVGCLSLLILGVIVLAIGLLWARSTYRELGKPEPEAADRTIPIPSLPAETGTAPGDQGGTPAALRLTIDMQEGRFEVSPGPPGSEVKVEGTFASRYYALEDERNPAGELGREVAIRLRPTSSFLVRMLSGLTSINENHPNHLIVTIPEGVPVALELRLSNGESRSELGGLTLTQLDTHLSKGSHHLEFSRPLVGEMPRLTLVTEMGEFQVRGLGNAHAGELQATTRMGACQLWLGGEWPARSRSKAAFTHSMGALILHVPSRLHVVTGAGEMGEWVKSLAPAGGETSPEDTEAPSLELSISRSMGGDVVVSRD